VPRSRGAAVAHGEITFDAPPTAATGIGEVTVALEPGQVRTLLVRWADPELDSSRDQENFLHFHCPAPDEVHGPGLTNV